MKTFLQEVAHDLYEKTHGDLSNVAVVFPNKRASLFFNEYLAHESKRPGKSRGAPACRKSLFDKLLTASELS